MGRIGGGRVNSSTGNNKKPKAKKELPAWVYQAAGSVVTPRGNKPLGSKPALALKRSVLRVPKKKEALTAPSKPKKEASMSDSPIFSGNAAAGISLDKVKTSESNKKKMKSILGLK
jgi:hypothetical protein